MKRSKRLIQDSLEYARRGWPVLPVHFVNKRQQCSCNKKECDRRGKHPRTRNGLNDATTDRATILAWWRKWPLANVGIATGNGLFVVDVDVKSGGLDSLRKLEAKYGSLQDGTPVVETGGGGLHIYLADDTKSLRNSASAIAPGIDARGNSGYVVAPPSVHQSGNRYKWRTDTRTLPLKPVPDWIRAKLAEPQETPHPSKSKSFSKGGRNVGLTALAGSLRRQGVGATQISKLLILANSELCEPPLPESEVKTIAKSIGKKPAGKPREREEFLAFLDYAESIALARLTDRLSALATLRAIYDKARKLGKPMLALNVRDVAIDSSISTALASKTLKILQRDGWIQLIELDTGQKSAIYRILSPRDIEKNTHKQQSFTTKPPKHGYECSGSCRGFCRNLWRYEVLGRRTEMVFRLVLAEFPRALTTASISETMGVMPRAARNHLQKLESPSFGNLRAARGLVCRTEGGYRWTEVSECEIAKALGVAGIEESQRARIKAERARYGVRMPKEG